MKISIIIPAYNEEKRIGRTLEEYCRFFREKKTKSREMGKKFDFEILVVINNTTDNTEEVVKKYSKKYREIRYLNFEQGGKGFAIIEGFKDVLKRDNEMIGFVDADMATPVFAFNDLIKNINGYDGIIASRWMKGAKAKRTFKKKIVSAGFNFIVRCLFLFPYHDTQCIPKFSDVFVNIDGKAVKESIENIKDKMNLVLVRRGKNFKIYDIKNNVRIPSLNKKTKRIEYVPISGFVIRKDKDKKLIKIKLEGGRTFFVSENHPLLMFDGKQFYEKAANQLKEDDLLPIVKKWSLDTEINYLDLIEHIKEQNRSDIKVCGWKNVLNISPSKITKELNIPFKETYSWFIRDRMPLKYYALLEKEPAKRNNLSLCFRGGKHIIPAKIKINNKLLRLLGYYTSEGCCSMFDAKNKSRHIVRISFNKNEKEFIRETRKLFEELFNIKTTLEYQENCVIIGVYSRILCYLFEEIFKTGARAFDKRVPPFIYNLSKEKIGNFIDTYFLGDGYISLHKQANSVSIRTNSASEKLIKDIQLLLLRLGITSNVGVSKRENKIMGRKIKNFNESKWYLSVHAGSNIKKFEKLCPLIKKTHYSLFSKFENRHPSFYERKTRDIENSDICFAKIKKIEIQEYDGEWYDFKIQSDEKPYENFMHDSGILSHNCGAKIFKRKAVEKIVPELGVTEWAFDIDLLYLLRTNKCKIKEHPTVWEDKEGSKILKIPKISFQMFLGVLRLRLINSPFAEILKPVKFTLTIGNKLINQ